MTLTIKDFDEIEKMVDEKIEEKTKNLHTKDEFFTKMDEIMGELKNHKREYCYIKPSRFGSRE